jgi:hypothetical protein
LGDEAIRFNVNDIQHRLRYGRAREFVQEFVTSPAKNAVFDLEQLGVEKPISFYNSCFQAAGRWFPGCKVSRRRKKYIIFEKQ